MTKLALNDRLRKKLYDLLSVQFSPPVLDVDFTTGLGYSDLSITSSSAYSAGVGPLVITDTGVAGKPAGYLGGMRGARVNGSAPAWTDAGGATLSGVTWMGPLPARTTKNIWSKPTPGTNSWISVGVGDGGDVPGPDGSATSARRLTFTSGNYVFRGISTVAVGDRLVAVIKGTNGNKINLYYGLSSDTVSTQITLNGEWQYIDVVGAVSGTPTGTALVLNTINTAAAGGTGVTASQTVDVFMLQASANPFCFIQTAGANITALAETVTCTTPALGENFSIMAILNYAGIDGFSKTIVSASSDGLSTVTGGFVRITDGTLTTTSVAAVLAAASQKAGFSRTPAGSTIQINGTQETGAAAVDWTNDTVFAIGSGVPVQRLSVWQRAIRAAEMTAYV